MKATGAAETPAYILGHSEDELGRLARQAKLVDPMTKRFFEAAGVAPGMRVLDVGSGAGDVAILAADLVGPSGQVVGVDRSARALKTARSRAEALKLRVSFLEGELTDLEFDEPFDAVLGRYVLMFQPDPAATLRALVKHLRPDGIVVFHEIDWDGARSNPRVGPYDDSCRWILETIEKNGVHGRMGAKLPSTFVAAGLPAPSLALESLIGGGEDDERIRFVTEVVGTLHESIVAAGVATAAEIDLATLPHRIAAQAIASRAVLVCRSEIGAWSRVPG